MKDWKILNKENIGAVEDKVWVTDGESTALFKPDSELEESQAEYETARIAKCLGIPCAEIEKIELFGRKGILSYNIKTELDISYCPAGDMHEKSGKLVNISRGSSGALKRHGELSVDFIKNNIPGIQNDMVNMLYLDCLTSNRDRHGGNWELMIKEDSTIIGIAPLFDHGMGMDIGYHDSLDYSMVCWQDDMIELKHFDMFEKLAIHYPEYVGRLIERSSEIDLDKFTESRYKVMCEIQKEVVKIREVLKEAGINAEPQFIEKIREINKAREKALSVDEIKEVYDGMMKDVQEEARSRNQMSLEEWKNSIRDEKKSKEEARQDGINRNYSR